MKKRVILLLSIIGITVIALIFGEYKDKTVEERLSKDNGVSMPKETAIAYKKILEENKTGIDMYNWRPDMKGHKVAFCDLDNNGMPEMFFVHSIKPDTQVGAYTRLFTYINNRVEEVKITVDDSAYTPKTGIFEIADAGVGTFYNIYKGHTDGVFYIYKHQRSSIDVVSYNVIRCTFYADDSIEDGVGITRIGQVLYSTQAADTNAEEDITYTAGNGATLDKKEAEKRLDAAFNDVDSVILSCKSELDNSKIWENSKGAENLSMTYEEAIDYLDGFINQESEQ